MKRLKQSEQVLMPEIHPASAPIIIVIPESSIQHLPFNIGDLTRYQLDPQPHKSISESIPRDNRLRTLMHQEQK